MATAGAKKKADASPVATPAWAALSVKLVSLVDIRPRDKNPRKHSEEQVEQIAASLLERGWTVPVLGDEAGDLIAGHGRLMAAHLLVSRGHKQFEQAPYATATGWTEAQKLAYVVADNQLALNSDWDTPLLKEIAVSLKEEGFDMSKLAMTDKMIDKLLDVPMPKEEAYFMFGGERFIVLVECVDEKQQASLFQEMTERGMTCKIS